MTPRKEIYISVKDALKTINELELIDLFRNQYKGEQWTAAFIRIGKIQWETMVEKKQEGTCTIDIIFYCLDGWMNQHHITNDPESGLIEIDLIDSIVEKLQLLKGEYFKPLELSDEEDEEIDEKGVFSYKMSFETRVYRRVNYPYQTKKLTLNTN